MLSFQPSTTHEEPSPPLGWALTLATTFCSYAHGEAELRELPPEGQKILENRNRMGMVGEGGRAGPPQGSPPANNAVEGGPKGIASSSPTDSQLTSDMEVHDLLGYWASMFMQIGSQADLSHTQHQIGVVQYLEQWTLLCDSSPVRYGRLRKGEHVTVYLFQHSVESLKLAVSISDLPCRETRAMEKKACMHSVPSLSETRELAQAAQYRVCSPKQSCWCCRGRGEDGDGAPGRQAGSEGHRLQVAALYPVHAEGRVRVRSNVSFCARLPRSADRRQNGAWAPPPCAQMIFTTSVAVLDKRLFG